jgi:hypothetical protein
MKSFNLYHPISLEMMKTILLCVFCFGLSLIDVCTFGQTVKVTTENIQIKGENAEGYEVILDGTAKEVEDQLLKFLKPVGKSKRVEDAYAYSLPLINGKNYTSPLYAIVRDKGKGAAWLGIRLSEWPKNIDSLKREIEKMAYDFGVAFYKDKIQLQIDESNRALQTVERQQQKLQNQNKDLNSKLENNKAEKIRLEKALIDNKLEFDALTVKIEQNKKDQDSVAVANEQIKKVIDMQKEKQRKVN